MELYCARYQVQEYIKGQWVKITYLRNGSEHIYRNNIIVIAENHDSAVAKVNDTIRIMNQSRENIHYVIQGEVKKCIGINIYDAGNYQGIRPYY